MIGAPKTLDEARKHRYTQWGGNTKGYKYNEGFCAYEVHGNFLFHQCSRKNGHGINGIYCKQHAKKVTP